MASIKDVAKAAGVSASTVSRTINNNPSISAKTKERVMREVKKLKYIPNSMAKSLSDNNSYTITLLVNVEDEKSFQNPFFYEVMHGIEKVVYEKEFCLIVANLDTRLRKDSILNWLIKGKRTEGVILPSSIINSKIIKELKEFDIPFVLIGDPANIKESTSWVDINNKKGGEQATYALIEKGYKRIAFIGLDKSKVFSRRRFEGYESALLNNDMIIDSDLIIECCNTSEDSYQVMKKLLDEKKAPDAVICAKEIISVGVLRAIREKGLKIPNDIGLISFDNSQIATMVYPTITTINVDVLEMGIQSAKLLFSKIENPKMRNQELLISTNIEERDTTFLKDQQ